MHSNTPWQPAPRFPVSVKGVAFQRGQVLLLENEREEWELPGGKLELEELPTECLAREVREESGWDCTVEDLLHCWLYHIKPEVDVFVVAYGCRVLSNEPPQVSTEHQQARLWPLSDVPDLRMPEDYKIAIAKWAKILELM